LKQIAIALGSGDYPSEEAIGQIGGLFGESTVTDFLDDFLKEQSGKRGLEFDRDKLAATLSGQDIEKGRQDIEKQKLKAEAGGKGEKKLTELSKMLTVYNKQAEILDTKILDASTAEEEDALNAKLTPLQEKINGVIAQMEEQFPDIGKLTGILSKLRSKNITVYQMEQHKEKFKKEENLSEEEYQYLKASL